MVNSPLKLTRMEQARCIFTLLVLLMHCQTILIMFVFYRLYSISGALETIASPHKYPYNTKPKTKPTIPVVNIDFEALESYRMLGFHQAFPKAVCIRT